MKVGPIKTEKHYKSALQRIEELWGTPKDSPEGDELDALVKLIENYEKKHYPIGIIMGRQQRSKRRQKVGALMQRLRHVKSGHKFTREEMNKR